MKTIFGGLAILSLLIGGCVTTDFPKTGAVSPLDGQWAGSLPSSSAACSAMNLVAKGEVRYGYIIAEVFDGTTKKYDLWGQIGSDGELRGNLGSAGVTGAAANIRFDDNTASGTWTAPQCQGTVILKRQ